MENFSCDEVEILYDDIEYFLGGNFFLFSEVVISDEDDSEYEDC